MIWTIFTVECLWCKFYKILGEREAWESLGIAPWSKDLQRDLSLFKRWVGVLERFIYTAGWMYDKPEVIAVILILKVTPSLKLWTERIITGRVIFNIFIIGSLLSLIGAVLIIVGNF